MTVPRGQQISLDDTPYYHCTARCVRRAFLCGIDRYTGKNFNHRRQWIEDRLMLLSQVFAIDLLAYAIMSDHYHVVLRINKKESASWSEQEVVSRWEQIFAVPDNPSASTIALWRARLSDLSWFMRCINERLARRANREDGCSGRFWEGRFKSQALLDESVLIKCMAYVDLNPVRAKMAATPEASEHTSIKARIEGKDEHLLPLDRESDNNRSIIPIRYEEYLLLVDWTGRMLRQDKRGAIAANQPPILKRLGSESDEWVQEIRYYGKWYYRAVGSLQALNRYCEHLGQHWLKGNGQRNARQGKLVV